MPFGVPAWEKLSIFLDHLVPKLPAPREDDLSAGILETIDMESYRVEKREAMKIALSDEEGAVEPVPASGVGHVNEPKLERLSSILQSFNDLFGNIAWTDADRVQRLITEEIPRKVAEDEAYKNASKNNDPANARVEHDRALGRVMMAVLKDDTELFKQFSDNESFRRWLSDAIFHATYDRPA
jgi:type I restriction enzyme, R subunit